RKHVLLAFLIALLQLFVISYRSKRYAKEKSSWFLSAKLEPVNVTYLGPRRTHSLSIKAAGSSTTDVGVRPLLPPRPSRPLRPPRPPRPSIGIPKRRRTWVNKTLPLLYPTRNNPTPYKHKPLCPDTRSHPGVWSTREYNPEPLNPELANNVSYWEPYECQYH